MKKLLLIIFISLGLIGSANAVSSLNDFYTSSCTTKQATGFTWEDNAWKKVNFKAGREYEITKLDPTKMKGGWCSDSIANYQIYWEELYQDGCYSIKAPGSKDYGFGYDCQETWSLFPKQDGELNPKTKKLERVTCGFYDFHFSPNGMFHTGNISEMVLDKDTKDNLYVSFGECSSDLDIDTPSLESEWTELDKKDDGETFYLAIDSIKKVDGFIYYWYMRDFADDEKMGPIRSEKIFVQGDCSVPRTKHLSYHWFKKPKGRDIEMSDDPESPEWKFVAPESFGGWLLNINCSLEERMGSMSSIERKEFIGQIKKL